jgi:diketogulonate reductase-like aldo/keto reductase
LDYVDLYLIHWPIAAKDWIMTLPAKDQILPHVDLKGVWAELEHCVEKGLIKSIGVSNFSSKKLESLLSYAKIPPAVNQVIGSNNNNTRYQMHSGFNYFSAASFAGKSIIVW